LPEERGNFRECRYDFQFPFFSDGQDFLQKIAHEFFRYAVGFVGFGEEYLPLLERIFHCHQLAFVVCLELSEESIVFNFHDYIGTSMTRIFDADRTFMSMVSASVISMASRLRSTWPSTSISPSIKKIYAPFP